MTAQIIPFPLSVEREVKLILGTIDFNELIQLRADLIDRLFYLVQEGDQKAQSILQEVGGKTVMEQVVILHRYYPYWEEWKEARIKKTK